MSFWIDPIEWLGLFSILTIGMIPTIFLLLCSSMKDWRSWFKDDIFVLPSWCAPPMVFSAFHAFFGASISIGVWLIWTEALRTQNIALSALGSTAYDTPYSGSTVDPTWLIPFIFLLYIVYLALKICSNFCFWIYNSWLVTMIISSLAVLLIASIAITSWFIWFVPGILLTIGFLWDIYVFTICVGVWKCWNDKCKSKVVIDHVPYIMSKIVKHNDLISSLRKEVNLYKSQPASNFMSYQTNEYQPSTYECNLKNMYTNNGTNFGRAQLEEVQLEENKTSETDNDSLGEFF